MGCLLRAGGRWSSDLLIEDCEDLQNLSASDIHFLRFKHQEVAQEGKLLLPCADGSLKLFGLSQRPRGEMPASGNQE